MSRTQCGAVAVYYVNTAFKRAHKYVISVSTKPCVGAKQPRELKEDVGGWGTTPYFTTVFTTVIVITLLIVVLWPIPHQIVRK